MQRLVGGSKSITGNAVVLDLTTVLAGGPFLDCNEAVCVATFYLFLRIRK